MYAVQTLWAGRWVTAAVFRTEEDAACLARGMGGVGATTRVVLLTNEELVWGDTST